MRKNLFILFAIGIIFLLHSCKRESKRVEGTPYEIKEKLDSIPFVTISSEEVSILNIKTLEPFQTYQLQLKDFVDEYLFEKLLFLIEKKHAVIIDFDEETKTRIKLPFEAKGITPLTDAVIIYGDSEVYEINRTGNVIKLADVKKSLLEVHALPGFSSILAVRQDNGTYEVVKISMLSKKGEFKVEIDEFIKMRISPFGKRLYVLTKNKLLFLDTKNLTMISEIPIKGEAVDFVVTASENKVFIFAKNPGKIISIKRTLLKVVSETEFSQAPEKEHITGDGGSLFFLSQDTLFRFDTGTHAVVRKIFYGSKPDIMLSSQKGLRLILGKQGESSFFLLNGNTFEQVKEVNIKGNLLAVACGKRQFRVGIQELPTDTVQTDTLTHEPGLKPQYHKGKYFTLQVSSSSVREGAEKLLKELRGKSLPVYIDSSLMKEDQKVYRVKIGAFETRKDAEWFNKGIKATYNLDSWVLEHEVDPYFLKEAGFDINGDKNGELLLHAGSTIFLFTNYDGIQKSVLVKNMEGMTFRGKAVTLREESGFLLGISFHDDSVLAIKWLDNKYEVIRKNVPHE